MIVIDGAMGEGGGQILRSTLALSLITGEPVRIDRIRAGRSRPGLLRQHLACVRAATAVGGAVVEGDQLGSQSLVFRPGPLRGGDFSVAVGSAGSALLVVQAVLPALLVAPGPSRLVVEGGTHNPSAPPAPFVERAFLPALASMGAEVLFSLERPGFYPAGGGRVVVEVRPAALRPVEVPERGAITDWRATVLLSGLPDRIARAELAALALRLPLSSEGVKVERVVDPVGPGNAVWVEVEHAAGTSVFTGFGERGLAARRVGQSVVSQVRSWEQAQVPVCQHLADQLLLPMALAGGGSFSTVEPTDHTLTNIAVIHRFLPVRIQVEPLGQGRARIACRQVAS